MVHFVAKAIARCGWAGVPFGLNAADRAEYARLSLQVLDLALKHTWLAQALTFDICPKRGQGRVQPGLFGVSGARNSGDRKQWLHLGYQSRARVAHALPEIQQPPELRTLWPLLDAVLDSVAWSMRAALAGMGVEAGAVSRLIFSEPPASRNLHIRTVRYLSIQQESVGTEAVAGHVDLGICSQHLYETHGGWFHGARYYSRDMLMPDSPSRRIAVRALRAELEPLPELDQRVIFFLTRISLGQQPFS